MVAKVLAGLKHTLEVCPNHLLRHTGRGTHNNVNPRLQKQTLGSLPHSTGDDHVYALFVKPPWQQTGLVGRRRHVGGIHYRVGLIIHIHQGKFLAVSEM